MDCHCEPEEKQQLKEGEQSRVLSPIGRGGWTPLTKGRGRRAAPAASTAAATRLGRAEEESPSAGGRVRPEQRRGPLALSSAGGISIETVTHTEAGVLGSLRDRRASSWASVASPPSPPHLAAAGARSLLRFCSPPRGSRWAWSPAVRAARADSWGLGPGEARRGAGVL